MFSWFEMMNKSLGEGKVISKCRLRHAVRQCASNSGRRIEIEFADEPVKNIDMPALDHLGHHIVDTEPLLLYSIGA